LPIGSRIATVTHAATTSVAQIEFVASQNRQEVTKLDENEADESLEIRLSTAPDGKRLRCRLTLIVVLLLKSHAFRSR
jgi:hypothetical protein